MPRDDYKEVCELVLVVLGYKNDYTFKRPGATHHARWMAKVIYILKMFLFRAQLVLEPEVVEGLKELSLFYSLIYVRWWIVAPRPIDASVNDLCLVKQLLQYKSVNKDIAIAAINKMQLHLWYLSPEYIPLSLFSDTISLVEKRKLQKALVDASVLPGTERKIRELHFPKNGSSKLTDYVDNSSVITLQILGFDTELLLTTDPATWPQNKDYAAMQKTVSGLKVTNDAAERAIGMMNEFNRDPRTHCEETIQNILQVHITHIKF
jgi:hypothetical protein